MKLRNVLFLILMAACYVLQAAFILWFWPNILQDMASGEWGRSGRRIKKRCQQHHRRRFDQWQRNENDTRSKRVWENRNDFYT